MQRNRRRSCFRGTAFRCSSPALPNGGGRLCLSTGAARLVTVMTSSRKRILMQKCQDPTCAFFYSGFFRAPEAIVALDRKRCRSDSPPVPCCSKTTLSSYDGIPNPRPRRPHPDRSSLFRRRLVKTVKKLVYQVNGLWRHRVIISLWGRGAPAASASAVIFGGCVGNRAWRTVRVLFLQLEDEKSFR
jgi:hypothetical protein